MGVRRLWTIEWFLVGFGVSRILCQGRIVTLDLECVSGRGESAVRRYLCSSSMAKKVLEQPTHMHTPTPDRHHRRLNPTHGAQRQILAVHCLYSSQLSFHRGVHICRHRLRVNIAYIPRPYCSLALINVVPLAPSHFDLKSMNEG